MLLDDDEVGDEVRARLGDKYFPATILEVDINPTDRYQNRYYIHFGHVRIFRSLQLFELFTHR